MRDPLPLIHPAPLTDERLAAYLNAVRPSPAPWTVWGACTSALTDLAIWVAEAQDPANVQGLVGYFFSGPAALGGEWAVGPVLTAPGGGNLYLFSLDGTKSARDDLASVISADFDAFLRDGSPVRKTARTDVGTRGTRKWAGLHGPRAVAWR
jgi:hypothetical protein